MIVEEIGRVLKTAQSASELTEKVFGPAGLLSRLAPSRKERKQFVNSPLFDRLQSRLNELHAAEEGNSRSWPFQRKAVPNGKG